MKLFLLKLVQTSIQHTAAALLNLRHPTNDKNSFEAVNYRMFQASTELNSLVFIARYCFSNVAAACCRLTCASCSSNNLVMLQLPVVGSLAPAVAVIISSHMFFSHDLDKIREFRWIFVYCI